MKPNKPHLRKGPAWPHLWACRLSPYVGYGHTPKEAYRNYILIRGIRAGTRA